MEWIGAAYSTSGRSGYHVDKIVPHIAECSTMGGVDATFTNGGREASAHYCVDNNSVHQYVGEGDTAWAVGNWPENCMSISIEHVGTTANPPSRATLDRSAALMADIARRYGWDELVLGDNVGLHKWYSATSCPGSLDYNYLISKANELLLPAPPKPTIWDGPGVRLEGADAVATCAAVANFAHPTAAHSLRAMSYSHHDAVAGMWRAGQLGARVTYYNGLLTLDGYIAAGQNAYGTQRWFDMAQRDSFGASLGDTCLVCSADSYMDAAAAGSVSYAMGWPVVYLEDDANFALQLKWYKRIIVIGGTAAVPKIAGETDRVSGSTANATMIAVADKWFADWSTVAIAEGSPDSVAACQLGVPVLPASAAETVAALKRHKPTRILWVGGLGAISYDRRVALCKAAGLM